MRTVAPRSKILFLSQESSSDVVEEALNSGAYGYVHKAHAHRELLPAIDSILRSKYAADVLAEVSY